MLQSTRISSAVLKFGLIGLLAGIVLVCGAGTVQFLVQGKVYSGKELRDTCRLPLLGTLASGKTRQSKQLDAALDRMEHRPDGSTDAEMIRLMAATIASRAPEAKHILITGDLPADQLTRAGSRPAGYRCPPGTGGYRRRERPDLVRPPCRR